MYYIHAQLTVFFVVSKTQILQHVMLHSLSMLAKYKSFFHFKFNLKVILKFPAKGIKINCCDGDWQLVEEFYLQQICLYGLPAINFGNKVKPYTSYFESSFIIKIYLN